MVKPKLFACEKNQLLQKDHILSGMGSVTAQLLEQRLRISISFSLTYAG